MCTRVLECPSAHACTGTCTVAWSIVLQYIIVNPWQYVFQVLHAIWDVCYHGLPAPARNIPAEYGTRVWHSMLPVACYWYSKLVLYWVYACHIWRFMFLCFLKILFLYFYIWSPGWKNRGLGSLGSYEKSGVEGGAQKKSSHYFPEFFASHWAQTHASISVFGVSWWKKAQFSRQTLPHLSSKTSQTAQTTVFPTGASIYRYMIWPIKKPK